LVGLVSIFNLSTSACTLRLRLLRYLRNGAGRDLSKLVIKKGGQLKHVVVDSGLISKIYRRYFSHLYARHGHSRETAMGRMELKSKYTWIPQETMLVSKKIESRNFRKCEEK